MRLRPAVTVALLAFVLIAVGTLIVKDARRSHQVSALNAEQQRTPVATRAGEPSAASNPTPAAGPATGAPTSVPLPSPPVAVATRPIHARPVLSAVPPAAPRRVVRVTYFHTTARCVSCYKIEALSETTVRATFGAALSQGDLVWRTINLDEPGSAHFVHDYGLFTKSVIVSEVVGGTEVRFKNLDRVWNLLGDEQAFSQYVADEVRGFLGSA